MAKDVAVRLTNVSKYYKLFNANRDRLKEALHPKGKKYHRNFFALKNINLEIKQGEILGIVGRNGSGKSTLLKIITGILYPNKGTVEVNGRISALLELGTGFNPEFTGIENVYFYGVVNGFGNQYMKSKVDEIIAFADIGEYINQPLKNYSSGMKTRLGFAVAIHTSPDILILDEVLAVGDELFRRKCHAKMEEFLHRGTTILYVSHEANSIIQMCTSAIFLNKGVILATDTPKTVTNLYQNVIYASPQNRRKLIQELQESRENSQLSKKTTEGSDRRFDHVLALDTVVGHDAIKNTKLPVSVPDFLEELKPQSTFEYRNENIDIVDAHIKKLGGQKVNVLIFGEFYRYSVKYHSKSEQLFSKVAFGFEIKNSKGTILTSIDAVRSFKKKLVIGQLGPGDIVELQVEFECRFPAGLYFTNSGLSSFGSGEQLVLNRKIDSTCFKVLDSPTRVFDGLFACMKALSIKSKEGVQLYSIE